jgi:diguanylate cyclase (GGDEF)-like protein
MPLIDREKIYSIVEKIHASESIILAIGIVSIVIGILVDVFLIRIICLLCVIFSAFFLFSSIRAKSLHLTPGKIKHNSLFRSYSGSEIMKKLFFDDFQSHSQDSHQTTSNEENTDETSGSIESEIPHVTGVTEREILNEEKREKILPTFTVADFFDVDSEIYRGETEPRTEFDFLLTKILGVIKEVFFAHTVAYFWVNREKQQMVLEAIATDSVSYNATRRFPLGDDLVSKVALSGKPEFITEVNPKSEAELFRYYETPASVKSFIGVPVFFTRGTSDVAIDQPVAVVAIDSKTSDEFGHETMLMLGKFTKLISAFIKSYNDKYELLLDAELLNSIRRMQERIRKNFSVSTVTQALTEESSKIISWDFLSIVLFDEAKHAWFVKKVTNRSHAKYITIDQPIDFPASVVGNVIKQNTYALVHDLTKETLVRYNDREEIEVKGSLISVPVSSINKCYGALTIESSEKYSFTHRDLDMLYRLSENAAAALEVFYLEEMINEYVIIDDVTGMYSRKFFIQRLEEELQRSDDNGSELSLLFITIDKGDELRNRFGFDGFERITATIARAIRACVRSYDLVGRFDSDRFGILLINTAANDAYLWAEKIRKHMAGLVINLEGKNFSITISVGVAGALEGMKKEELIGNTVAVLGTASQSGGNVVRVF